MGVELRMVFFFFFETPATITKTRIDHASSCKATHATVGLSSCKTIHATVGLLDHCFVWFRAVSVSPKNTIWELFLVSQFLRGVLRYSLIISCSFFFFVKMFND